jgi:hypothetical protein
MLAGDRGAVVVVARVAKHDVRVGLSWQGANCVREHIVRQSGPAVIQRFARPHPVTRSVRIALHAVGALARVIPRRLNGCILTVAAIQQLSD